MARLISQDEDSEEDEPGSEREEPREPVVREEEPWEWDSKIHALADFYNLTWDEVSSMNIVTFVHKINYRNYYIIHIGNK